MPLSTNEIGSSKLNLVLLSVAFINPVVIKTLATKKVIFFMIYSFMRFAYSIDFQLLRTEIISVTHTISIGVPKKGNQFLSFD
jgi:hypothetical protein